MRHRSDRIVTLLLAAALWVSAAFAPLAVHAATFVIANNDGAGEGFNDATVVAPVGGNTGITVGAQRLIAFQFAANIWAGLIRSPATIRVAAQFDPLACNTTSAVLGSAGPKSAYRDFSGAPAADTWYPVALASARFGSDLDTGADDITAKFNSNIGTPGCLDAGGWYYGLDSSPPGGKIDFVAVLLHELGHGLGFLSFTDLATGAKLDGMNDAFMLNLEHHGATPSDYPSMTDGQRITASIATGNLHWTGANVRAASGVLSAGKVGDHVSMYAPNPQEPGSSVSHFDTALTPNQVMEPSYTGPLHSPVLELPAFQDIGWQLITVPDAPVIGTATAGNAQATVTFTAPANDGGSAITGYAVTSAPAGGADSNAGTTGLSHVVTGLTNGTAYTFTVTATNAKGTSPASAASNSVTPATVPGAPTIGTATAGDAQAMVTFTAPANDGGSAITGYTATSAPGSLTGSCTAPCTAIIVTGLTNGVPYTFTVRATNTVGTGVASAASNSVTPTGNQAISFGVAPAPTYSPGGTFSVSATATSGLAVSYSSLTTSICTVDSSSGLVTIMAAGACTIAADQSGNAAFNPAPQATQLVNIAPATQTVTFAPASPVTFGASPISLTATASSGLTAFTFSTGSAASICTVAGDQLTITGGGTCALTASQAGNSNYNSASANANVLINPAGQIVTFAPASPVTFGVSPFTLTATATSGLTAFTFSTSSAASICTVAGDQLTVTGGGSCALTATQAGNANYASASANASVVIDPASQTVTFAPASPVSFGIAPITLTATATSGLTAFTFSTSSAASICSVAGNQLTIAGTGTCALTATQAGNASFNSASANANVIIDPASQTVTFTPASPVTFGVAPITLTATATSGLTAFIFSTSSAASICTVAGSTLTIAGTGTCALTASQAGNANYASASANASVLINPAGQTVTFAPASPVTFGIAPITLSATATSGLTAFTFSTSSTASICTVAGNQLTIAGTGTCALTASQAGNANYNSASANANVIIDPASQTVTFAPASPVTFGVAPITLTATATSGLTAFTFSTSSAASICTIAGNQLTIAGGGTCALTASQAGNANYNSASANASVVINPASQTATFTPASPVTFGVSPVTLTATATSGLTAFTFSTSSAASICTVAGNQLTIAGTGTCALTASQAGNANYSSASANANVVINPAGQTVTFTPASPVTFGVAPITLTAAATSGLTVFTFSTSSAASICTVAGNTLTVAGAGTCALTASQAGNSNYNSASANASVVINPASQTVTFAPPSPATFGASPITLTATATSGLTVFTFTTSSAASICTVAGNTLTITGTGTCALTASQAGNANYNSASANANVVINPASQTVTFAPASPVTFGVAPITLTATASSGLTAFTFSTSSAASICTVTGNQLTIAGTGTCALTASQAGNANYNSASANANVVINPAGQTVSFTPASPVTFGVAPITLTATATSGLTVFTFTTSSAASICTVAGNTLTITGTGTCALTASQAGNANYNSTSANANVVINSAGQTVTFTPASPVTFGVAPITLAAAATSGLTAFTFSTSSAASICTVAGNQLTIAGAGTCALTASQAGNANYNSASANANVVINPASQTVIFSPASPVTFGVAPIALTATATSGLIAFTFTTSSAASICTVAGNTLTIAGAGTCALTANQAGNANYNSASANANVVINPAGQTVSFTPASPVTFGVAPITLTATASSGLTAFTFTTSSAATICTVAGNQLTIAGTGTCALTASQAGNANYANALANANVLINPATQTVSFAPASPVTFGVAPITLAATSSSGLTVFTFTTSSAASICTVAGNVLTIAGTGTCALTATQAGNANYIGASANANVVINPASQTVTFAPTSPVTFGVAPFTLTATATSGLTVFTFTTSSAASICTVTGNTLTITSTGTCALTATQAGNANYIGASANANVIINPASQTVTFAPASPVTFGVAPIALTATATSGLTAFTFTTSSAASICTVAGNTLTIAGTGTCTLTASQAGNANYASASANAIVMIDPAIQMVTFTPVSPVTLGIAPITLTATATSDLTAFTFATSSAASICTVAGNQLTIGGAGTCALTATQAGNANYASASASANVVINIAFTAVQSRKIHGGTGPFDVEIDTSKTIDADVTVEPRASLNGHAIVFQFNGPVTAPGSVSVTPAGSATATYSGSEVIVTLTGVPDNQRVTVTLTGVNASVNPPPVSMGFLVGDVNSTRSVNASDISGVKAHQGQLTSGSNFQFDVNASGSITANDVSAVKARSGLVLP